MSVAVYDLGLLNYGDALKLQQEAVKSVKNGGQQQLFFVEHPRVITAGKNSQPENFLYDEETLKDMGFDVFEVGRGGDVTYHGPGQLLVYPILRLGEGEQDLPNYVTKLEEVIIRTCFDYGVKAERVAGLRGVWVGNNKIAAIGVRMSRWVTMHGFALNVTTTLDDFNVIVPCGLKNKGVTSLLKETGKGDMGGVMHKVQTHFEDVFQRVVVTR